MEILNTLMLLGQNLLDLAKELLPLARSALLPAVWIAWWLWGVNWHKAFPALAQGAWVPLLLLVVVSALVWSRISPSNVDLGFVALHNFWWQLGAVGLYIAIALLCGWLQLYFHYAPPEISLEPSSGHAAGDHGHDEHGHHEAAQAHGGHDAGHEAHH